MSFLEELMICIMLKDRLLFLKFRHKFIKTYGREKFQKLLNKANKEFAAN